MFPLLETIKVIEGIPQNLDYHQMRFENSYEKFYGFRTKLKLTEIIFVPPEYSKGKIKARFLYNNDLYECNFSKYIPIKIKSIRLIVNNNIEYSLKYSDRRAINILYEMRGICDDILIIKNGVITDSSFANIVLYDGRTWYTPMRPLLKGSCRERLISEGKITPAEIKAEDLKSFSEFKLINALRDFDEQESSNISGIQ
jgi:4-amino-4-deoxychorismate lyase